MKKRLLSAILSIVMVLTVFSGMTITAHAASVVASGTSGSVNYSLDSDGVMTLSGNGATADYSQIGVTRPWYRNLSAIKNIVIEEGVTGIGKYAFYNCTNLETIVFNGNSTVATISEGAFYKCSKSTYWLNIPASVTTIGKNAFNDTGFNWVTIESPSISIQTNSFGQTNWAQFLGLTGSGVRDFVEAGKSSGNNWRYLCLRAHNYVETIVDPTCTAQGYTWYGCTDCDVESNVSNYVDPLGHNYVYLGTEGTNMLYSCSRCGQNQIKLDIIAAMHFYENAISYDEEGAKPYQQSNYIGAADVYTDGYVNAKDFLLLSKAVNGIDVSNKKTTVNTSSTYQTIDGFGASAAWWSQEVGGWENLDEIIDLLYSKENGIGLDIYRYNLGGGSEADTAIGDWRRRAEDFLSPSSDINNPDTYDWNADVNARRALASAQRANSDLKVTLFSNTAPVSLTDNGKGYCNSGASKNLSESNYQAFANYVVNCAQKFREWGYNVTTVSPVNEPEWGWDGPSQEGCHWEAAALRTFYNNYMVPTIQNSSVNGINLSVWESGQLNHSSYWNNLIANLFSTANSYKNNNANIRAYVDTIDTHSYWASESDRTTVANQIKGTNYVNSVKNIRCTEYCQMTNDGNSGVYDLIQKEGTTNGMTMAYGIAMANIIYQDLTILNAIEWDWWTACSGGIYPDGLVYTNSNNHADVQTSKRLWCLGNFSKFIEEGAVRISVTTTNMDSSVKKCAFKNPDGSIAIVYINNTDNIQHTSIDGYTSFESYVTDETMNLELYQHGSSNGRAIAIPARSVTTVVVK